jgi:signal peptidase II
LSRLQAPRRALALTFNFAVTPEAGGAEPLAGQPDGSRSVASLYVRLLGAATIVVGLDQLTKHLALRSLDGGRAIEVIPGVLRFRLTYNSGGAFGILQGAPSLFLVATIAIVAAILLGVGRVEDHRWAIPLGLVLGGGLGNAIDRLVRDTGGGVVDFIDVHLIDWPVFNLADSAIVLGAALILIASFRSSDP